MHVSALPEESRLSEICLNKQKTWKKHPRYYRCT